MNKNEFPNSYIYADASATSPIRKEVIEVLISTYSNSWGNSSSLHKLGTSASYIVEKSRKKIANILGCDIEEIVFTSGATESNYLAIMAACSEFRNGTLVLSSVEHPSMVSVARRVEKLGWKVRYWPVDRYGQIQLDKIDEFLSKETRVLSIISAQSEIGTLQPIEYIAKQCRKRNIIFHTDATQLIPNQPIDLSKSEIDFMSFSAHKFQGPKGIGLLFCNNAIKETLSNLYTSSNNHLSFRPGTEPTALIAGMARAIELIEFNSSTHLITKEITRVESITRELREKLERIKGLTTTGHRTNRLANHISLLVGNKDNKPLSGRDLVLKLSNLGLACSSGSACSSSSLIASHVLKAIKVDDKWLKSALRISLGPWNRQSDIEDIPRIITKVLDSY